jgi:Periplasmic binding protein
MLHKKALFLLIIIICISGLGARAQGDSSMPLKTYRVGIFAPLYLDSVFTDEEYNYGKGFPKFALQGLDFVQGAQIALDSLPVKNASIKVNIFDSKSTSSNIASLIRSKQLDSLQLIIGSVKDQEYMLLSDFALQKNIPFISATHPNDGGITANPFTVIVNPTLKAHCEAIYAFILQNHGTDKIYLVRRQGSQENVVEQLFRKINAPDGKSLLPLEVININQDYSVLKNKLDSNRKSIIIGGSLNESFAGALTSYVQSISKKYAVTLIGMPNWDGMASIVNNKKLKDFPVFYTSPYQNTKWDNFSKKIKDTYLAKYKGIPSDLTYKGFETTYQFVHLLSRFPNDFISHLNDYPFKIFSDYHFKPVFLNKNAQVPDYFENKNLYFVKILNGNFSKAW